MWRRWAWAVLVLCWVSWANGYSQCLPWAPKSPSAEAAYLQATDFLQIADYGGADSVLRLVLPTLRHQPSDQLLLASLWAQSLAASGQFQAAVGCIRYCARHFHEEIRLRPAARAVLLDCLAEMAIEVQLTHVRKHLAHALAQATTYIPADDCRQAAMARKVAVLYRLTKDNAAAHEWFAVARHRLSGDCADSLRLYNEEAFLAAKNLQPDTCLQRLTLGAAIMVRCKTCRPEDEVHHQLSQMEYHYRLMDRLGTSSYEHKVEARRNIWRMREIALQHPGLQSSQLFAGYMALANLSREFGNMDSSAYYAKMALDGLLRRGIAPKYISVAYTVLAEAHHYLGQQDEALDNYHNAILSYPQHIPGENDSVKYIELLANYAQELINNEQFARGEEVMWQAVANQLALDSTNASRLSNFYLNLAVGYDMQGCLEEAAGMYARAADLHASDRVSDLQAEAQCRLGAATELLRLGRKPEAETQLKQGVAVIARIPQQSPLSHMFPLLDLANYHLLAGDLEQALQVNAQLLSMVLFDYIPQGPNDCPDLQNYLTPWYTLEAVHQKMVILRAMYVQDQDAQHLHTIVACGQKAIGLLRRLRQERNLDGAKLKLNEQWHKLYEQTLQAELELHRREGASAHLETAFKVAEMSKAMVLMEAIVENQLLAQGSAGASAAAERRAIQGRIALIRNELADGILSTDTLKARRAELQALQTSLDQLLSEIQSSNPRYFDLVYGFDMVPMEKLQATLALDDRTLVEFFYGDSTIYTFVVNPKSFTINTYSPDLAFSQALDSLIALLQTRPDAGDLPAAAAYARLSQTISAQLWQPLRPYLRHKVTVIPDGPLSYLSFEALLHSPPKNQVAKFHEFDYVLEHHTVSYHYSATFLCAPEAQSAVAAKGILAMAPEFAPSTELPPLPHSMEGIAALGKGYEDVHVVTGDAATKQAFLQLAPNYNILDLATHGKFDRVRGMDSRIYFSADGRGDSLLYLRDLYNLKLPAELAILEACETGMGDYRGGEGVMSLARGFTYAGCKSVLMSLWQVPEGASTEAIIHGFYDRLASGLPRDEAVAEAKRAYLKQVRDEGGMALAQSHPYYWSELVMIGKQGPVAVVRRENGGLGQWMWAMIGGGLVLVAGGYIWNRRRRAAAA